MTTNSADIITVNGRNFQVTEIELPNCKGIKQVKVSEQAKIAEQAELIEVAPGHFKLRKLLPLNFFKALDPELERTVLRLHMLRSAKLKDPHAIVDIPIPFKINPALINDLFAFAKR